MSNSFDKMLPKTTSYWKEGDLFFVKNTSFFINNEEGKAMAELLIHAMTDPSTKAVVCDNRLAKGAWPQEVLEIWASDSKYTQVINNKKMATLTSSSITAMQTNRVSKNSGLEATSKAFNSDFNDEVKRFLLG